jgi:uncharacterized protein (TIGR02147 family)
MAQETPCIYDYVDFQQYLRDTFEQKKASSTSFSYARLAESIGVKSKSFAHRIVHGQVHSLSPQVRSSLGGFLRLTPKEQRYLEQMVEFKRAKSQEEKQRVLFRLQKCRPSEFGKLLSEDEMRYYTHWFFPVVREMVCMADYDGDMAKLGQRLDPPADAAEVADALMTLLKLRMVEHRDGKFVQTQPKLISPINLSSSLLRGFHQKMIELGLRSLQTHPTEERDINCMTFSVRRDRLPALKQKIQQFQFEITQILEGSNGSDDSVYQLNVQLFPLTKTGENHE